MEPHAAFGVRAVSDYAEDMVRAVYSMWHILGEEAGGEDWDTMFNHFYEPDGTRKDN